MRLVGAIANRVDFGQRTYEFFATEGSAFSECSFLNARFTAGYLDAAHTSVFTDCRFDGETLQKLGLGPTRFVRCSFENVRIASLEVRAAEFVDCRLSGKIGQLVVWAQPEFPYNSPDRLSPWRLSNEFRGNDLSQLEVHDPDFRGGVRLAVNTMPSGPEYVYLDRWPERARRGVAAVSR